MKNANAINSLCLQLKNTSETLSGLAMDSYTADQQGGDLERLYEDLVLDEVQHIQLLTLEITRLATEERNDGDDGGTVFQQGDLNSVKDGEVDDTGVELQEGTEDDET